jgi:uncharacterized protein YecT (DUF1311 family)
MIKNFIAILILGTTTIQLQAQQYLTEVITKKVYTSLIDEVSKEAKLFEDSLRKNDLGDLGASISYEVAKFKVEKMLEKRLVLDYNTLGINTAIYEASDSYDTLMNIYYNNAIKLLSVADKKVMVAAQKAWLAFRDKEKKLITVLSTGENSSGGTIQSNIVASRYLSVIKTRTNTLYDYYNELRKARYYSELRKAREYDELLERARE